MKATLARFHACALFLAALDLHVFADSSGITLERTGNQLTLRWQADPGATQLQWTTSLGTPASWQLLPGVVPNGGPIWEKHFTITTPSGFFRLAPAALPVAPPNVRLNDIGGHFLLEWDSTSDAAGYVVYVGTTSDVGPGDYLFAIPVALANSVEIDGLVEGQTYFIAIAATNAAGEGPIAMAVTGVFGPKGVIAGDAVQSFQLANGETFDVGAEGAAISFYNSGSPAALPISATADERGHFRVANVPVGTYFVGFAWNGQGGIIPTPVDVPAKGVALSPLVLPIGPQPSPPGSALLGTLTLSNGDVARIDLDEFAIHERSLVHAFLASGAERVVQPDARGAWAITDILASEYPLTLVGTYQGMQTSLRVNSPPTELTRSDLQFSDPLPTVRRIIMLQGGHEVQSITRGVPVTFNADIDNPTPLPVEPRWIVEFNGTKYLATGVSPTFTFNLPPGPPEEGLGDPRDSAVVGVTLIPSGISLKNIGTMGEPIEIAGQGCWMGLVAQWSPFGPDVLNPAHPATVKVTHSGPLSPSTASTINNNAGGYFEMNVDPTGVPPYLVRVEKPGFMRFLWPFEQRLPVEGIYSVTAAISNLQSQNPSGPRVFTHPLGGTLTIPWGEVLDPFNQPWYGDIVVTMTTFDPTIRHPLPPGAEVRGPNLRNGILPYGGFWFDITDNTGVPLVPTTACTLTLKVPSYVLGNTMPGYHQVESTGYFERWGYYPGTDAQKTGTGQFTITLGTKGLFLVGFDWPLVEMFISPDRTLGYPFDMRIGKSIFAVTVQGFHQLNIGRLFVPSQAVTDLNVLELRHAPGLHYPTPATPTYYLSPMQKIPVVTKPISPNPAIPSLPAIATFTAAVSLNDSEPKLTSVSPNISSLNSATHFFSRGGVNTASDANDYYTKINAPPTLAQWRSLNGFPSRFGGPLSGVSVDDYSTAYYYNLGDLGFARAQTMRIKLSSIDSGYDTAFQVTNYRSLEDAICGRGAIATVCMDFSKRYDTGQVMPSRYTRFYVYDSAGLLTKEANLDGAGLKGVPNLCVICHGGNFYDTSNPNRTPNLGSRFLPFDLESYTYHPKYGVQQAELARMNKGVLLTAPTAATADLITGWYGTSNPLTNLYAFNQTYVPSSGSLSWSANTNLYTNVFKPSCRVCHNSRETTGYAQFSSYSAFQGFGFGNYPAGSSLQMPHAQRPWGVFWGSRCAVKIGGSIPDMPTILGTTAGNLYR